MAEDQSPEQLELLSHVEILLSVSGADDVAGEFKDLCRNEKEALKDAKKLEAAYGSLEDAAKALVKRHNERKKAAGDANKTALKGVKQLQREFKSFGSQLGKIAKQSIMAYGLGGAIKLTLEYNKSMLSVSTSINRLGIGMGLLERTLKRVGRETSLTRMETIGLFDKFQENMRFVSLQQFEGMLKRLKGIVGSNSKEMEKYQSAIAAVSQTYPGLSIGLLTIEKAGHSIASSQKAVLQSRIRNLYFIGKIKDAEYKRLTAYVSGNQQVIGADRERQKEMQSQIKASQEFKRQWESVSMTFGKAILPLLEGASGLLGKLQKMTEGWNLSATQLALTFTGIYAGMKLAGGGMGGGIMGAVAPALGGLGTRVQVTNWPISLGGSSMSPNSGPQLPGKGGVGRKAGRFGKVLGTGKPGGALGTAAIIGGSIYGSYKARQWGQKQRAKGGYGNEVKANFATIGSQGLGGAAIGGRYGGLPGAAIGATVGLITGAITTGFDTWFDKSNKEKKAEKTYKDLTSKVKGGITGSKGDKDRLGQGKIDALWDVHARGVEAVYEDIAKSVTDQGDEVKKQRKIVDAEIKKVFGKKGWGGETLKGQQELVSGMKQEIDDRGEYGGGTKQKEADAKTLEAAEKKLSTMEDIEIQQEKNNTDYGIALDLLKEHQGKLSEIETLMSKQRDLVEGIQGLYKTQSSLTSNMIEQMAIMGNIDPPEMFKAIDKTVEYLGAEMSARKKLISILKMENPIAKKKAMEEEANNKGRAAAHQALFAQFSKLDLAGFAELDTKKQVLEQTLAILAATKQQTQEYQKAGGAYSKILGLTNAQATGAGLLVQLADNYAIGVGASVAIRKQEYLALEDVKQQILLKLKAQQRAYMKSVNENASSKRNIVLRKDMVDTQNELTQATIKQASTVKSMRDAWISAIAAMNTGSGSFSEIIMNAEQNTAQIQQLDGAVRSSASGAYGKRDAFGYLIEDVGQRRSERMTSMGDISSPGREAFSLSYDTGRQYGHDDNRALELLQRGRTSGAVDKLTGRSAAIGRGDPTALAAAANKYTLSSQTERLAGGTGGTEQKGAFSFGGGVSSTYIGPPPESKAAPCFVANKESDAIPVFVVNSKDIQGGAGTSAASKAEEKAKKEAAAVAKKEPASVKEEKKFIEYKKKELAAAEKRVADLQAKKIFPEDELKKIAKINKDIAESENRLSKKMDPVGKDKSNVSTTTSSMVARLAPEIKSKEVQKYEEDKIEHEEKLIGLKSQLAKKEKEYLAHSSAWSRASGKRDKFKEANKTLAETGFWKLTRKQQNKAMGQGQKDLALVGNLKSQLSGSSRVQRRRRPWVGAFVPGSAGIERREAKIRKLKESNDPERGARVEELQKEVDRDKILNTSGLNQNISRLTGKTTSRQAEAMRSIGGAYAWHKDLSDPEERTSKHSLSYQSSSAYHGYLDNLGKAVSDSTKISGLKQDIAVTEGKSPIDPLSPQESMMNQLMKGYEGSFPMSPTSTPVIMAAPESGATIVLENINLSFKDLPGLNSLVPMLKSAINEHVKGQNIAIANAIGQYRSSTV